MATQTGARISKCPRWGTTGRGLLLHHAPRRVRLLSQATAGADTVLAITQGQPVAEPHATSILQAALQQVQPILSEATAGAAWNFEEAGGITVGSMVQPLLETANASVLQATKWLPSSVNISQQLTNISQHTSQELDTSMQALAGGISKRLDAATDLFEHTMPGSDKFDPAAVQELGYSMLHTIQHWAHTFQELMAPSLFGSWDLNMMFFVSFTMFTYTLLFRAPRH